MFSNFLNFNFLKEIIFLFILSIVTTLQIFYIVLYAKSKKIIHLVLTIIFNILFVYLSYIVLIDKDNVVVVTFFIKILPIILFIGFTSVYFGTKINTINLFLGSILLFSGGYILTK